MIDHTLLLVPLKMITFTFNTLIPLFFLLSEAVLEALFHGCLSCCYGCLEVMIDKKRNSPHLSSMFILKLEKSQKFHGATSGE